MIPYIVSSIQEIVKKINAVISVVNGKTKVQTDELCVGSTCVTEDQLKQMMIEHAQNTTYSSGGGTTDAGQDGDQGTSTPSEDGSSDPTPPSGQDTPPTPPTDPAPSEPAPSPDTQ